MNTLTTIEIVTPPSIEPITLAQAKEHLNEFSSATDKDNYINSLIVMARSWVEDYTGRACIDQVVRQTIEKDNPLAQDAVSEPSSAAWIPSGKGGILLRRSPVISIVSVHSVDAEGIETLIDADTYALREPDSRWPRVLPLNNAVWNDATLRITYRAGFADLAASPQEGAEKVPLVIIQAMKLIISNFYENREPVNVGNIVNLLPLSIEWLLRSQKAELGFV